jgi:DNA polymerase I-like protein with 3'-5' exonuclease and polymerase domains
MLKITKVQNYRELTSQEYTKLKGVEPFKTKRQLAKTCHFLLIYAGSAMVFAENGLETSWTRDQCLQYIKENHCEDLNEQVRSIYKNISNEELPFVVVATHIRNGFFATYPGLLERIEREREFAAKHGYVRSPYGHTRKLIQIKLAGEYDKKYKGGLFRNSLNKAGNSEIQNAESSMARRAMYDLQNWLHEHHYQSTLCNEIHDSIDMYVKKDELRDVVKKAKEFLLKPQPELMNANVPLEVDCEVSDINAGDYYKGGRDIREFGIEDYDDWAQYFDYEHQHWKRMKKGSS